MGTLIGVTGTSQACGALNKINAVLVHSLIPRPHSWNNIIYCRDCIWPILLVCASTDILEYDSPWPP